MNTDSLTTYIEHGILTQIGFVTFSVSIFFLTTLLLEQRTVLSITRFCVMTGLTIAIFIKVNPELNKQYLRTGFLYLILINGLLHNFY